MKRIFPGRFTLPLLKKKQEAQDAFSFFFDRSGVDFHFLPGQFVRVTLDLKKTDERSNSRLFTIASSPTEKEYVMITTRIIASAFKMELASLQKGAMVKFQGPFGSFILDGHDKTPRVFLAGGIGITPFRSMSVYARDRRLDIPLTLFVSFSSLSDIVYLDELREVEKAVPHFKLVITITQPLQEGEPWSGEVGRIDDQMLRRNIAHPALAGQVERALYLVAGPPVMVKAMVDLLIQVGIPNQSIKSEDFSGY